MANLSHAQFHWDGPGQLQPGSEHYWWMTPIDRRATTVVAIMAHAHVHAAFTPPPPVELLVKDVRSHIDARGGRVILFTVRNTGPNAVAAYSVNFAIITA